MDSDVLDAVNGGFIFFEETHEKTTLKPSNYGYESQYLNEEESTVINPTLGNTVSSKYLRSWYVNRYDSTNTNIIDQQISLSANHINAGQAYILYETIVPAKWLYLEASWWSASEGITSSNGQVVIQYKDHEGNWVTQMDLLNDISGGISISVDNKTKIKCIFECPVKEFRIYVKSNNPISSDDMGRLVIGNMILVHEPYEHVYTYVANGNIRHTATCCCGYTTTQSHSFRANALEGRYASCIQCGYLADLGSDMIIKSVPQEVIRSINGSYILPSGMIVLVDEDIESYLNGSLEFYIEGDFK